uniref:Uncharacterized protein n=1 Tax=Arundo donax TaxID=35708 RepID=A0A0A9BGI2_ARUDO
MQGEKIDNLNPAIFHSYIKSWK